MCIYMFNTFPSKTNFHETNYEYKINTLLFYNNCLLYWQSKLHARAKIYVQYSNIAGDVIAHGVEWYYLQ